MAKSSQASRCCTRVFNGQNHPEVHWRREGHLWRTPDSVQEWVEGSIATISPRRRSWTWAAMIRESEVKLVSSLHICDDLTRGDWGSLERLRGHSFITQSIRTSRTSYLRSRTSRLKDRFFPQAIRLTTRFNPLYRQTLMCNLSQ